MTDVLFMKTVMILKSKISCTFEKKLHMKISRLLYLILIGFTLYSCSDDDTDLPGNTPPEEADNYFPLVIGNFWDYENVFMPSGQDDFVSNETLSVVGSSNGNFDLDTDNLMDAGPVTSALSQGILRKSGDQLIFTGSLGFVVEGFPALDIALDNAPIYDLNAPENTVMYSDSGSFQETIEGVPVTFTYEIKTVMDDMLSAYTVNGTSYNDVIKSKIILTLKISAELFFEVTILPEQEVVDIENYFAKDIGMIYSDTDVDFDFIELSQSPIPLEDIEIDITQSLESYNVELEQ